MTAGVADVGTERLACTPRPPFRASLGALSDRDPADRASALPSGDPTRIAMPDDERPKLWVRSGGRGALCKDHLHEVSP